MSSFKRKRDPEADSTAWILGTIIVLLVTLDLLVWASLNNAPNPIAKAFADSMQTQPRAIRTTAR